MPCNSCKKPKFEQAKISPLLARYQKFKNTPQKVNSSINRTPVKKPSRVFTTSKPKVTLSSSTLLQIKSIEKGWIKVPSWFKNNVAWVKEGKISESEFNRGLQSDWFSESTWTKFISKLYTVSDLSSRMGIRLKGNNINSERGNEILTEGIPLGGIQVPGGGDPIISFVEHQTTGGYPKIANVITADLCKVGQLKGGDEFKFELVSIEEGEALRLAQESYIQSLKNRH